MKRITKLVLLLGLAGPSIVVPSCTSALVREGRSAAIGSASTFLGDATLTLLQDNLGGFFQGGG